MQTTPFVMPANPANLREVSAPANSSARHQRSQGSRGSQSFTETLTRAAREINGAGHEPEPSQKVESRMAALPESDSAGVLYSGGYAAVDSHENAAPAEDNAKAAIPESVAFTAGNLTDELIGLLQALGFADSGGQEQCATGADAAEIVTGGPANPGLTLQQIAQALTTLGQDSAVSIKQLKQVLEQLLVKLEQGGETLPETNNLKALIRAQLNESTAVQPREFLNKLGQVLAKAAETVSQGQAQKRVDVSQIQEPKPQPTVQSETRPVEQPGMQATDKTVKQPEQPGASGVKPVEGAAPETVRAAGTAVQAQQLKQNASRDNGQPVEQPVQSVQPAENRNSAQSLGNNAGKKGNDAGQGDFRESDPGHKPQQQGAAIIGKESHAEPRTVQAHADQGLHLGQIQNQQVKAGEQPVMAPRAVQVIFGQIVQKAKAVTAPGISEVQIQLKPDFLGKLNLSISSENGLVTAKFSAETYQVKAIIETNLNMLKDALAEQGVKVDQLLVNVGTDKDYSGNQEQWVPTFGRGSNGNGRQDTGDGDFIERMFETDHETSAIRAYYGNTVDFTA